MSNRFPAAQNMVDSVLAGEFRAVAKMITLVENRASEAADYLRELFPHTGNCFTIGVTGAPGSGKSTLVDALASHHRQAGRKVGIIAVDPTSPFSGGAILGDRIRMQSRSTDPGTFIRSMATRGHLGGLARATGDVLLVLDAAGFDVVIVETVGVGQDEIEIVRTADATLVLLVPGMGDDIQAMKAGIMEIGDIFVINKADRPGVQRVEAELGALLASGARPDGWTPRVVKTIASENKGLEECAHAIQEFREFLQQSHDRKKRAVQIQRDRLIEMISAKILQSLLAVPEMERRLDDYAGKIAEREIDPFSAADALMGRLFHRTGNGKEDDDDHQH
jgi:LAO/AO transport system kinase